MKLDTPLPQLRYFLPEDLYLLKTDEDAYRNPSQEQPAPAITAPAEAPATVAQTLVITPKTPAITFKYLGSNQKNFLVLCHYPQAEFMTDAHLTALNSTVTRLNFAPADMAILNLAHNPAATWTQLLDYFKPAKLLVLGAQAQPAGLPTLTQNEVKQLNGCQCLYTFSFDEMMGQKENTKAFWNQIKTF